MNFSCLLLRGHYCAGFFYLDSDFKQQRLKAWQPILTPKWVIATYALVGIVFIPIGAALKAASDNIAEYSIQYDGDGSNAAAAACRISVRNESKTCDISFTLPQDMTGTVYVYYELDNYYQVRSPCFFRF